jgi:hypothetical protein
VFVCVTSYIVNTKNYHVRSDREDVQEKMPTYIRPTISHAIYFS